MKTLMIAISIVLSIGYIYLSYAILNPRVSPGYADYI